MTFAEQMDLARSLCPEELREEIGHMRAYKKDGNWNGDDEAWLSMLSAVEQERLA